MEQYKETYDSPTEPQDSPTEPQGPQAPSSRARFHNFANTFWVYEIFSSITSLAMLGVIFIVLNHYNSTDINTWSHSWALNSLIGLLATASQITMAFPLTSCISQLKWLWYKDNRKLTDLDTFDQSSRGPFGSLGLLFSRPFKFLGSFGAILIILSLAFHTLVQNAISTKSGLFELNTQNTNLTASYPQGNNYSFALDYSTGSALGDQGPTLDMVADIDYGMFYYISNRDTQFQLTIASCYFGNCTWDHIQTLSVCSKCADVTSYIGETDGFYTLENLTMSQDVGLITSLGSTFYPNPTVLQDIGPLIVHFTAMVRETTDDQPVGVDCALYWCVLDSADVIMTNYNITSSIDTVWTDLSASAQTTYQQTEDVILTPPTCYNEFAEEVSDTTLCTKTVSKYSQLGLQNFFISETAGFTGMATTNSATDGWNISSDFVQLLYLIIPISSNIVETYSQIMDNIGYKIQDNIQQQIQGGYAVSYGRIYFWTTLFNIRWDFLIASAALVGATMLFLLVTIVKSWRQERWKSSLLPLLFHPLAERPRIPLHEISDMKAEAKAREVRLEKGHLGSKFV